MPKQLNLISEMLDFQLMCSRFYYFVGLTYAEPDTIRANMEPLRSTIMGELTNGSKHKMFEIRQMYKSTGPQIEKFLGMIDQYLAGELPRQELIAASEALQKVEVKRT